MTKNRITRHPILEIPRKGSGFTWNGETLQGYEGEMIASALIASDIHIFGHHHKDNSPQGMFCANGQCSQCMVIADGLPVKSCMTPPSSRMWCKAWKGSLLFPRTTRCLPERAAAEGCGSVDPGRRAAGLSAAIELGKLGVDTLVVDDKSELGGKLCFRPTSSSAPWRIPTRGPGD